MTDSEPGRKGKRRAREHPEVPVTTVTLIAVDRDGNELRRLPGFRIGQDSVGHGLSMAMGAAVFVNEENGEVVRKWNPWGVL